MALTDDAKRNRLIATLVSRLEAITTDSAYFFEPTVVAAIEPPPIQYLNEHLDLALIYTVHEELETQVEVGTGFRIKELEVFITCFYRWKPVTDDPIQREINESPEDKPYEIRGRMIHDVEKVIELESPRKGGNMLNGDALNLNVSDRRSIDTNAINLPQWLAAELRLEIEYETVEGDPTT